MTNAQKLDFDRLWRRWRASRWQPWVWRGLGLSVLLPVLLHAHQISAVAAKASFERDGSYRFDLSLDVTGSPDPAMDEMISPEEAALTYLREALEFRFDGEGFEPEFGPLEIVPRRDPLELDGELVEMEIHASGRIPPGAQSFQVRLSPETEVALVMRVFKDGIAQRRAQTLFAGEVSRPIDLGFVGEPVAPGDPFAKEKAAEEPVPTVRDGLRAGAAQMLAAGGRRVLLVLLLLLLTASFWQTGLQILLFTLGSLGGHFLMRALGVELAAGLEEALLLLALMGLAFDNVSRFRVGWSRFVSVTLAGALLGVTSRSTEFESNWAELLSYHGGVLLVVVVFAMILWVVIGSFRSQPWFQERLVLPLSFGITGMALFWLAFLVLDRI